MNRRDFLLATAAAITARAADSTSDEDAILKRIRPPKFAASRFRHHQTRRARRRPDALRPTRSAKPSTPAPSRRWTRGHPARRFPHRRDSSQERRRAASRRRRDPPLQPRSRNIIFPPCFPAGKAPSAGIIRRFSTLSTSRTSPSPAQACSTARPIAITGGTGKTVAKQKDRAALQKMGEDGIPGEGSRLRRRPLSAARSSSSPIAARTC